ncbi:NAD-dependent DNA ligase LigA [Anaerobium acetethylicum]|uniref:DNA ligase n=1 Tax=Anaerobium acetethylicum TaxID=1619234 RepID=A0A1D3TTN4_9FIRM|nr:NAD-dependent DNA ligase LigA [Anaerobium acetethylicum]SCP97306.1 DNA ligase (NAD+) [Anaerobium acetethylicum]
MEDKIKRIKELVKILNEAGKAYYQQDTEIMSNFEYDRLYDELLELEDETGMIMAGSPSAQVGYESLDQLPKERHEKPMLSLDKTKDVSALVSWVGNQKALLSWKLDGLTIVLTYRDGELQKAVTRGNGEIGEVITPNAKVFKNLPHSINFKDELIIRGEAVITYSDFEKINAEIEDVNAKYKNPRNLCSGSVRQLNNEITAKRNVNFFAFSLVKADDLDFGNSREEQFRWLKTLGFEVVEYKAVTAQNLETTVREFESSIQYNDFPSDGLVLLYDDMEYGASQGRTAKFPKDAIAFKWADEIKETKLLYVEWSPSRTGLINPIAVFEPVELEGTTVSRASLHNISIMKSLELGAGDTIEVYKANMIIPQVASNHTRSGVRDIPETCPVCGGATEIRQANDVQALYCTNPECQAKKIKSFTLFVSRDAMNMEGLSEATLEKMIQKGFIHEYADIFHLAERRDEIVEMEGFGEKSYVNLIETIEKSRKTTLPKLIYSLGIENVGLSNAKVICRELGFDLEKVRKATREELNAIAGIGPIIADTFAAYFEKEENNRKLDHLLKELEIEAAPVVSAEEKIFTGMNFVITGSVEHFANRNEVKDIIESKGGKVTGSVTAKTNFLINNDAASSSSKNKKAKELGVKIITEEEFVSLLS